MPIHGHFISDMHMIALITIHGFICCEKKKDTWVYPTKKIMRWFHNEYWIVYQAIPPIKTFQKYEMLLSLNSDRCFYPTKKYEMVSQ